MRGRSLQIISLVAVCLLPQAVGADQNSPLLPPLFEKLGAETDTAKSLQIERQIWRIWGLTKNARAGAPFSEGVILMTRGALADARSRFDNVIANAPEFAEGWNKRATVAYMQGDFTASVRDIQQTLALEPRHFGALSGLSLIYEINGQHALALDVLIQAKEIYPAMPGIDERLLTLREAIKAKRT